ncbi:MAG: hypothetical protein HYX78_13500 [Armatimonadetes bacterium]|nr:hypothetical protein [Armatimonadota bacterium]
MNFRLAIFCLAALFAVSGTTSSYAGSWTVFELAPWEEPGEGGPRNIVFTFENNVLSLNTEAVSVGSGGSSTQVWQLLNSGSWAAIGSVDGSGDLVADPYASFVTNGFGGYVEWSPDTPTGYTAPLLLGHSFNGNGAATYQSYSFGEPVGEPVSGTLTLWSYLPRRELEDDTYTPVGHTFYASNVAGSVPAVPEPLGIVALISGLVGLAGIAFRSRRRLGA